MRVTRVGLQAILSLLAVLLLAMPIHGAEAPTSLMCTSNAKASRDYAFREKQWAGTVPSRRGVTFGVATRRGREAHEVLRDKMFSKLDTDRPAIRSITPAEWARKEVAAEFEGLVISRDGAAVFLIWRNDSGNKVWLAAINLEHRRAVVTQTFDGVTSLGAEVETLDCR